MEILWIILPFVLFLQFQTNYASGSSGTTIPAHATGYLPQINISKVPMKFLISPLPHELFHLCSRSSSYHMIFSAPTVLLGIAKPFNYSILIMYLASNASSDGPGPATSSTTGPHTTQWFNVQQSWPPKSYYPTKGHTDDHLNDHQWYNIIANYLNDINLFQIMLLVALLIAHLTGSWMPQSPHTFDLPQCFASVKRVNLNWLAVPFPYRLKYLLS